MARPKRMGAYNALDDLIPGAAWDPGPFGPDDEPAPPPPRRPRLEPVPDPPRGPDRRAGGGNALDDLLPGPSAPPAPQRRPAPRPRDAGRHLGIWNPLDDLAPGPPAPEPVPEPVPAKARVSFRLPADLVEAARDAVAHLAGTADGTTLTALAERALRFELARLAITHNQGRPFPPRDPGGGPAH
jgi:hypothetical protein